MVTGGERRLAQARLGALSALLALALLPGGRALAGPPAEPSVVEIGGGPGAPGGELKSLVGGTRDTRLLVVYGYARLIGYDRDLELVPDIAKAVEVEDGRIFTFHLRDGHRWSDGAPFTTEDFRYWWQDVATNEQLSPVGPPRDLVVEDELPTVEILDALTVRYSWSKPNPFFLPALAGARPLFIYAPAHYLRQFHADYARPDELARLVTADRARDWAQLHGRRDDMYRFDNPDLPTLQPWVMQTRPPAVRFVAGRNPYYHRVDRAGQQLPYIDRVALEVVDEKLIPVKTGAGETDLQARGLAFKDTTFLKQSEAHNDLKTMLWPTARGAHLALYPNLNAKDPVWRALFRDPRFRRALSLGIDRDDINQTFYFGLGIGGNNSVLPASPLYEPEYRYAWAGFDPAAANRLLDELGLARQDGRGARLLPDGRPMDLIVESAGESVEETDVMQLVIENWQALGIKAYVRPSQRQVLRNRIFAGETLMAIWFGLENGIPSADMSPYEFAPTTQQQYQWPKWGQHYETSGQAGAPPDQVEARLLLELYNAWRVSRTTEERRRIWHSILEIYSEQVYSIGIIAGIPQPVVADEQLRNVPEKAIYNWEPGAQFGIYRPDTFWFANGAE
ncbi:MAG: putative oligopeptide transporter, periplasmic oligopeptide-binding protein [Geminicoccaceae bacterium]|nr:putative oligopeptide transporter, periplasmic oligopeptide-binding protein [Geminicoccaceae bacterium]